MIVDCHTHLYTDSFFGSCDVKCSQDDLVIRAVEAGIDRIAVSSLGRPDYIAYPSEDEVSQANLDVGKLMRAFPKQVYGFCYLNPRNKNWREELAKCLDLGMIGVKLWIASKASSPVVFPVVEKAIEKKLVVLQHSLLKNDGNLKDESTPFDVAVLAAKYPKARIIMAHASGNQQAGIEAISPFPNVSVDTSGGFPERGLVEKVISCVGAKRVLFGSDAPGRSFSVQLAGIKAANISKSEKKSILAENFLRLLDDANN